MSTAKINQKEFILQNTTYAFVISLIFPMFGILLEFLWRTDLPYNLSGIRKIYSHSPVQWFILSLIIIVPVVTYFFLKYFYTDLSSKDRLIEFEQNRSKRVSGFIKKLIDEDFSESYEITSESDDLEKSLDNLRKALKTNKEQLEKRRQEDEMRNWVAEGLAFFGDILRNNSQNMELLAFNIVRELTKYIHATQGSFYLLNDEDSSNIFFQQTALYAYDRRKMADQIVNGEMD
ncbi:MAG: hypothetical protein HC906_13165 [Bacteroidales bacterium]|nr:hypothetical protein [Bacteroidales bacterium]